MIGTWINIGTIILGSLIGIAGGARISQRMNKLATSTIGLVTLVVGIKLSLETQNVLIMLISLLVGGAIGTAARIEDRLSSLGERLQERFPRLASRGSLPQGFVSASLLFCVGPMSILGALRDGLYGDWQLLGLKAVMDGISSIILVAGLGPGVILSVFVVLIYQGGISLIAHLFTSSVSASALSQSPFLSELDAVGGIILIVLSLKLLELRDLRAGNLLPALAAAPLLVLIVRLLGG
ncbi:DUF554 domain-containing protein [Candidatus Bipolaricaulota bacterium]|jgi:uncharacterized membrane protein YqgA involved in biofilm formation|nr:DUF554 domain-containing protein [Candidatus Bipolaricaulota bacterium]